MLHGTLVTLRTREDDDVAILHAELYNDVLTRARADQRPWVPVPLSSSPYLPSSDSQDAAQFSVVERDSGELAGEAVLWGIDRHNRSAHVGLSLRPSFRGRGLGTDVVRVLTHYGLGLLGLHRLQLETLADNAAMIAAAQRTGYRMDGTLRQSAWVDGEFLDEVVMSLLRTEWGLA